MASDVSLSAGIRSNLLLLQQTQKTLDRTQLRLATGNKVNSALDGPNAFFQAKGLTQRAGDLTLLKDGIGQAISTIKAGDTGITSITSYIEQAKGLTTTALNNLGTDANSVSLRKNLAEQYNSILRQIDKLAQDSGYQGKNLLIGSGLRLDATSSSKLDVNAIAGISGAKVTNVTASDTYTVKVTGNGAVSGNSEDIANSELDRGISNLVVNGFTSTSKSNFDDLTVKLSGGIGKSKTFTVAEGSDTFSQTFTQAQWTAAKASGDILRFSHEFNSGTNVSFDIDFEAIEDVADTGGVGTSTIEKNIDLQLVVTNATGDVVARDALNNIGAAKVAGGENAFAFGSGTARFTVDERTILQASAYTAAVGTATGTGSGAIVGTPAIASGAITQDETFTLTATGVSFNYATSKWETLTVNLEGSGSAGGVAIATSASNANALDFGPNVGANSAGFTVATNFSDLSYLTTADAADATEVEATESFTQGSTLSAASFDVSAVDGFAANTVTNLTYTVTTSDTLSIGDAGFATITASDGQGGTFTTTTSLGTTTAVSVTIAGGANNGATATLTFNDNAAVSAAASAGIATSGTYDVKVRGEYTASRDAQFDVRAANTGQTAKLVTQQAVDGTDANNLTVQFNETRTSTVTVVSQNVQTDGQGLQLDLAQNSWSDRADIDSAIRQLDTAALKLRSASSSLSTNLNIIQTRETYTSEFTNVLTEGAGKLTLADQNEEGANILTLQTRQQLGTISLSLANQAQQAILRLF